MLFREHLNGERKLFEHATELEAQMALDAFIAEEVLPEQVT